MTEDSWNPNRERQGRFRSRQVLPGRPEWATQCSLNQPPCPPLVQFTCGVIKEDVSFSVQWPWHRPGHSSHSLCIPSPWLLHRVGNGTWSPAFGFNPKGIQRNRPVLWSQTVPLRALCCAAMSCFPVSRRLPWIVACLCVPLQGVDFILCTVALLAGAYIFLSRHPL